ARGRTRHLIPARPAWSPSIPGRRHRSSGSDKKIPQPSSTLGGFLRWNEFSESVGPHRRPTSAGSGPSYDRLLGFARVQHVFDGVEFHVVQLAVDTLYLADIDVLNEIARFGVHGDRAAGTFEALVL